MDNVQTNFVQVEEKDKEKIAGITTTNTDTEEKMYDASPVPAVPIGITSFDEFETFTEAREDAHEARTLVNVFKELVDNIFYYSEDKSTIGDSIENLTSEFKSRLSGLFSKEVKETAEDDEISDSKKSKNSFMVFKDKSGRLMWLTSYSNNIRDDDRPPEIISSESHRNFVKMVDEGKVPLPELWLWHNKDWVIGQAVMVDYDEDNGMAIASGYFNKEALPIAEYIEKNQDNWGVSHGMPSESVVRNKEDSTIIERHVTREISPLPLFAAANRWANINILKENDMLNQEKRQKLIEQGVSEEAIAAIEQNNEKTSLEADALELERKEVQEDAPVEEELQGAEETVDEEPATEEPVGETEQVEDESADEEPAKEVASDQNFTEDQLKELAGAFGTFGEKLTESIINQVKELMSEKKEAEEKDIHEQVKEVIRQTPAQSLQHLILEKDLKSLSAIYSEETKIDGRSKLAQSGPEEVKAAKDTVVKTFNPILDNLVTDIVSGIVPGVETEN